MSGSRLGDRNLQPEQDVWLPQIENMCWSGAMIASSAAYGYTAVVTKKYTTHKSRSEAIKLENRVRSIKLGFRSSRDGVSYRTWRPNFGSEQKKMGRIKRQ